MYEGWFGFVLQSLGIAVLMAAALLLVGFVGMTLEKWMKRPSRAARLRRKSKRLYEKAIRMEE